MEKDTSSLGILLGVVLMMVLLRFAAMAAGRAVTRQKANISMLSSRFKVLVKILGNEAVKGKRATAAGVAPVFGLGIWLVSQMLGVDVGSIHESPLQRARLKECLGVLLIGFYRRNYSLVLPKYLKLHIRAPAVSLWWGRGW